MVQGGFCTLHYHLETINVIFVVSGEVDILQNETRTTLSPNQAVTILPGTIHQFRAKTKATAYELNIAAGVDPLDCADSTQLGPAGVETTNEAP